MKKREIKVSKAYLFKRTLKYILAEKKLVISTFVLSIITAGLSAFTPFITKTILDDFLPNENYEMVIKALILYGVVLVVCALARYFYRYLNNLTGMHIERAVREEAIRKIDYLPVDYYSLEPDGKIVAKITSDSTGVRTFYVTIFQIINALLNIVIVYAGVIILNPMLGLIVLGLVPILTLWVTVYRKRIHSIYVDLRETSSKITGKLNELITGTLTIQNFNQEDLMLGEYKDLCHNYVLSDRKAAMINNIFGWELLSLIKRIAEITLLMYMGFKSFDVVGTTISIGLIEAISENLDKMINPVNAIFQNLNELENSLVGATRCYMFIDEANDTRVLDGKEAPASINGDVEFKNIKFAYVDDKYVLNDVSLHVDAGKTIGIVGHTGSGKSSMMNLLLGYNDYQDGKLLIDGVDLKEYNKASMRRHMGIVLQTPALFAGTIKSNITMERDFSDEEVIEVLKNVGAGYMLEKNPLGINAKISFRGENLSLGEKQLISFARILLRNPKILVLDEATANIDSDTEAKIQNAMKYVSKGRTTFIIAHRLSTIKHADEIIVLDKGVIVGRGKHNDLYKNCVQYKDMYDSQYKNLKSLNQA